MPKDKDQDEMPYGAVHSPGEEEAVEATERAERRDKTDPEMQFPKSPGEDEAEKEKD